MSANHVHDLKDVGSEAIIIERFPNEKLYIAEMRKLKMRASQGDSKNNELDNFNGILLEEINQLSGDLSNLALEHGVLKQIVKPLENRIKELNKRLEESENVLIVTRAIVEELDRQRIKNANVVICNVITTIFYKDVSSIILKYLGIQYKQHVNKGAVKKAGT